MTFSAQEEISLEEHEPEQVIETEDGLKMSLYSIDDKGTFLDLDWQPGSKWEFLDTVEPNLILDALVKELFGAEEAQEILDGLFVVDSELEDCGCNVNSEGACDWRGDEA